MSDGIEPIQQLLASTMNEIGATIEAGPRKNESNGVYEWTIKSPAGGQVIFGITETALREGADIAAVLNGKDFTTKIAGVGDSRVVYVSSDLKIREWTIEEMPGD